MFQIGPREIGADLAFGVDLALFILQCNLFIIGFILLVIHCVWQNNKIKFILPASKLPPRLPHLGDGYREKARAKGTRKWRTSDRKFYFHMSSLKIQTKKLSILPRFYFHDALEQMKTNFHANFRFKRVLGFVIEYA